MALFPRTAPILKRLGNGFTKLGWHTPPKNIFIVKKDFDPQVVCATQAFIRHITKTYNVNVFVETQSVPDLAVDSVRQVTDTILRDHIDMVVTLGGDGTILRAASLFITQQREVPPVLSFSLGTLGFLLPFDYNEAPTAFDDVYHGRAMMMQRNRLRISSDKLGSERTPVHAMNDLTIHRGSSPHLTYIDIRVDDEPVTTAIADGLTIATPTGSTAYSLSAGGSIVHPAVPCTLVTPICPRSLSFRPLIFPQDAAISVAMGDLARGPSELSIDGISMGKLESGDTIHVQGDRRDSVWCVTRQKDDWVHNLNALLGFNSKFGKAPDLEA